jgi:FdhD protein
MFEKINIIKIDKNKETNLQDTVIEEVPLTIDIDNYELVTLLASPSDLKDLVFGFLYTSGLIKKINDIENIILDRQYWSASVELKRDKKIDKDLLFKRLFTSGCGKGIIFYNIFDLASRGKIKSNFKIKKEKICKLMSSFQMESSAFKKTGGAHSAGLADGEKIIIFREDIGRHNAIDKVIGAGLKEEKDFSNLLLLTSGRVSSEIIFKVKKANIPIVASQSAPTNQAVKLARDLGITLLGFVRGLRMNIYSREERLN